MQVERSSNTEWQTGEYNVGICLLVWNNSGKPELIPDKPTVSAGTVGKGGLSMEATA